MPRSEKKPVHKVVMTEGKRQIIHQLLQEYDIETAEDIQDALKDLHGGTLKEMLEAEMDDHLGYEKSERSDSDDYRNGYKEKAVNSSYGSLRIDVPQDRKSTFEPKVVKKRQKDISDIDKKIISMYAKGMTTRQISDTLMDIYGFEASESFISDITDKILPQIEEWQTRPLDDVYPVVYIDAIHYSVRSDGIIRKMDDADPELGTGVRRIIGHVRRPISRLRIPANKMKGWDNPPPVIDMPQIMSYIISSLLIA